MSKDCWHAICINKVFLVCVAPGPPTDISTPENIDDFVKESILMLGFDHPNVLKLLGVCFDTDDHLPLIVLPFMANGDLRSYLLSLRNPSVSITLTDFPMVVISRHMEIVNTDSLTSMNGCLFPVCICSCLRISVCRSKLWCV